MNQNVVLEKSKKFAIRIINLYKFLINEKKEFVLSKQILRSGTSVGANVKEAVNAQSRADFISKMYVALKEAGETEYWLELLYKSDYINRNQFENYYNTNEEIIRIITTILKTAKKNL